MISRLGAITLPVTDLAEADAFYRDALGLPGEGVEDGDDHAAYEMQGGLYLVLITRPGFALFTGIAGREMAAPGASGCVLSHFAESREAVDAMIARAKAAGADAVPADDHAWGYAGYVTDPDGHLWDIMWNPGIQAG